MNIIIIITSRININIVLVTSDYQKNIFDIEECFLTATQPTQPQAQ